MAVGEFPVSFTALYFMSGRELLFEDLVDLALESSLETLGGPSEAIDYEKILYEALVNEGVHTRVRIGSGSQSLSNSFPNPLSLSFSLQ